MQYTEKEEGFWEGSGCYMMKMETQHSGLPEANTQLCRRRRETGRLWGQVPTSEGHGIPS